MFPWNYKRILFLDLEETLFDCWNKGFGATATEHIRAIKKYIETERFTDIRVFSYAVYNQTDADEFKIVHQDWLERILDCKFNTDDMFTVEKLYKQYSQVTGYHFDSMHEFMQVFGKQDGFRWYTEHNFPETHAFLIDDMVTNSYSEDHDLKTVMTTINVKSVAEKVGIFPNKPRFERDEWQDDVHI